jgi:hypothetical protein
VRRTAVAAVFAWLSTIAFAATTSAQPIDPVMGADATEIASADELGGKPRVHISVNYAFEAKRAAIKREWQGPIDPAPPNGVIPRVNDLLYSQDRHLLTPRVAVGFYDVELAVALPIVLSDSRELRFDQSDDPCDFDGADATCVNADNSTTIQDGLLPGAGGGSIGYDAEDPMTGFTRDGTAVFRGIGRAGLDQIHVGLNWAALNQARDDTKPTWVIGIEGRFSIGKIMKFNRLSPGSEDGVSRGVHEFRAHTEFSKRTTWAEPFVGFWWQAPIGVRGSDPNDEDGSLFWDTGFGQENKDPQQEAGTWFGLEAYAWEKPEQQQRLTIEILGRISAHFEGRNYSEMWEVFSFAGDPDGGGPLILDADPTNGAPDPMAHPGVTDIENYLTYGARIGVRGQVGERAKFSASFELGYDQEHIVTFTDAGDDRNENTVVDPGTDEVNPLHKPIVDMVGRRYVVDDAVTYTFLVNGTVMF